MLSEKSKLWLFVINLFQNIDFQFNFFFLILKQNNEIAVAMYHLTAKQKDLYKNIEHRQ